MSYFFGPLTHIVSCLQKMSDDTLIIIDINVKNVTKRPNRRSKSTLTGTSWSTFSFPSSPSADTAESGPETQPR